MTSPRDKADSHKHQSELIDEFDQLLGKSIRHFQQLEQIVEFRILQLAAATSRPTSEIANFLKLAVAEVSFSSKLRLLATLLSHQIPNRIEYKACQSNADTKSSLEREMNRAIASIKRLSKIEELRNRYVHSYWMVLGQPPEVNELISIVRYKTRATPKKNSAEFEEFSSETFREFLAEATDAGNEMGQSTGSLLGLLVYDEDKKDRSVGHKKA